jgi:hypothetical protein
MAARIRAQGRYELFETAHHHKVLVLDKKQWFAAVEGQQGDILVKSNEEHEKAHMLQDGKFFIVEFKDDPKFNDVTHLFLENGEMYQEIILPNGLPSNRDTQKRIVWTDDTMPKDDLEYYLDHPKSTSTAEKHAHPRKSKAHTQRQLSSTSKS